jgi:hypothetical protein
MGVEGGDSDSERRRSARHIACAPAHIHDREGGKPHLSLIRDLSITGALIYTRTRLEVGDTVELTLYLEGADGDKGRPTRGEVVRFERRSNGVLWPYLLGVRFDPSLDDIEPQVKALAEHQAKLGGLEPG